MDFDDQKDDLKEEDISEPTDEDLSKEDHGGHHVEEFQDGLEDESQFKEPLGSPGVLGEEDPLSGSASDSEPIDIDKHLEAVGLKGDNADELPGELGDN